MTQYIPVPDNDNAFYAFVNLIINNGRNVRSITARPNKIGPVSISYTRNEVNEPFIVCNNLKDSKFVQMIINQFNLLHIHWEKISNEIPIRT